MEKHRQAVRLISATVRGFYERGEPYRIAKGSTNSTRPAAQKAGQRSVDIGGLRHVLAVDAAARTALVEPNVAMDRLVEHTLPHGLVPPVVMEFPGITAGGGFAGTAGESSSFRHGYFDRTVRRAEMVLADGRVVEARPPGDDADDGEQANANPHADLFDGAAGAVGSLGITTLLELRLIRARRFVRTTYTRTRSVAEAVRVIREATARDDVDYVDGILFSKDHGVVISGQLTDELPAGAGVQTFSGAWDPWFYLHVRERTSSPDAAATENNNSNTDYIPLAEYLFRYDRGGFWVGQAAFDYFRPVPFTRFFRWFLDDFLHTRMLYRALHGSGESARFFVQDLGLPYAAAEPFVDYVAEHLGIWPLWLCPLKTPAGPSFHPHLRPSSSSSSTPDDNGEGEMLNIGVWGWGPADPAAFVRANRALEAEVARLGGQKWLYAHTYYPEPEFWAAYGDGDGPRFKAWYEALRSKYHATSLPSVYDKVHVRADAAAAAAAPGGGWKQWLKGCWPVGGLWGIWKGIQSRDYLLHRRATWKWGKDGEKKEKTA
ncbi:FAD binding domain-containing protein [Xylariomycetidae sp. FL0641]|nr:FAD binding domain-containing protein [Xylariomycetidae sp. FL0641]